MSRVVVASVLLAAGLLANLPAAVAQTSNATCLSSFAWVSRVIHKVEFTHLGGRFLDV